MSDRRRHTGIPGRGPASTALRVIGRAAVALALVAATACAPVRPAVADTTKIAPAPGAAPTSTGGTRPTPDRTPLPTPRAQEKGRVEQGSFQSAVLRRTMPYTVYLPPGYDAKPAARYPTLYMLHGGTNTEWADYGLLDAADRLMGGGAIAPLIIVLPQGDQEYWVDHVLDRVSTGAKWGTYAAREVAPEIDRRYRTIARREGRAIGGLSMGGHGAIQLAMNFPGIWSAVGAHGPSLRPVGDAPTYLGTGAEFAARDPLSLITAKPELARMYSWWIDSGEVDPDAASAEAP